MLFSVISAFMSVNCFLISILLFSCVILACLCPSRSFARMFSLSPLAIVPVDVPSVLVTPRLFLSIDSQFISLFSAAVYVSSTFSDVCDILLIFICSWRLLYIYRWLSNQRSYVTNGGFEIRLNILIHDTMNGHRLFYMYQIINHFCYMLEHDVTCFSD